MVHYTEDTANHRGYFVTRNDTHNIVDVVDIYFDIMRWWICEM